MKIIYLDIDGVLWTTQDQLNWRTLDTNNDDWRGFCRTACRNLNFILMQDPSIRIVISSTWRIGSTAEELQEMLHAHGANYAKVIGCTPALPKGSRGTEIKQWMDEYSGEPIENYVILDDDSDMLPEQHHHFVQTNTVLGLTLFDAVRALRVFGIKEYEGLLQFDPATKLVPR